LPGFTRDVGTFGSNRAKEGKLREGNLDTTDLAEASATADFVQENGPERVDFKQKLYGQLDELLPADVTIASSSSGIPMEVQR
jgi:3-hydroxyacyl-CoA dehydrogenase